MLRSDRSRQVGTLIAVVLISGFNLFYFNVASADITIDGENLHIETAAYSVRFDKGVIDYIHNKLTDETYTLSPGRGKRGWTGLMSNRYFWDSKNISTRSATLISATLIEPSRAELLFRQGGTVVHLYIAVEPNTDDLLIEIEGVSDAAGVIGMQWGISYLDIQNLSVIAPVDGGRILDVTTPTNYESYPYPGGWEAQLAIVQGNYGGFYVRNTDNTFQYKRFIYDQRDGGLGLNFGTQNQAPFDSYTTATSHMWRFNTYAGDWRVPARIYRDWMEQAFQPRRLSNMPTWVDDITLVVNAHPEMVGVPEKLAELVDPTKTLLQVGRWFVGGEPTYPDYIPKPELRSFLEDAQQYGFRIMFYTVAHGMSPSHSLYSRFQQYQYRDTWTGELIGQCLDQSCLPPEYPLAHISPASSEWRNLLVSNLRSVWEEYPIDAFVLDANHSVINDGNGFIDGLNMAQGMALLHKQLAEAMPGIILAGERLHEATFGYASFAYRGLLKTEIEPHPISTFLFSPFIQAIGPTDFIPDHDPALFHEILRYNEIMDAIPKLTLWGTGTLRAKHVEVHKLLEVARGWQPNDGLNADINGDGQVNILDLTLVGQNVGITSALPAADLNGDGEVNVLDLILVANMLGR